MQLVSTINWRWDLNIGIFQGNDPFGLLKVTCFLYLMYGPLFTRIPSMFPCQGHPLAGALKHLENFREIAFQC